MSYNKQLDLQSIVQELSERLETGLSPAALEAVVDLLRAGVEPAKVIAAVTFLQQQQRSGAITR